MKTQISRASDRPGRRYSGVYQQQGRMITDADWNELVEILKRRLDDALADVVGSGMPRGRALALAEGAGQPVIVPGEVVVDGVHARVAGDAGSLLALTAQADFPGAPPIPAGTDAWLYLDVWERVVDAIEDDALRDPGLHGADTTTRTQTMVQVKWCPIGTDPLDAAANPPIGDARVAITLPAASGAALDADGCIAVDGSTERIGNYLFRVEVHDLRPLAGGAFELTLKWSGENGAERCDLRSPATGAPDLALAPPAFTAGHWSWERCSVAAEQRLGLHLCTPRPEVLPLLDTLPTAAQLGSTEALRRWDGHARLHVSASGQPSSVEGHDRGQALGTAAGPGQVETVTSAGGRRALRLTLDRLVLEIELGGRRFVPGDHWLAAVRENASADARVALHNGGAPLGVRHHLLRLGQWRAGRLVADAPGSAVERQRSFPPLSALEADRIGYDPAKTRARWLDIEDAPQLVPRWLQRIGGAGRDAACAIAADADGDLVVGGGFDGALAIGGVTAAGVTPASHGVYLARLAADGTPRWLKAFAAAPGSQAQALAIDPATRRIVVAGTFVDTMDLGAGHRLARSGDRSVFVACFSAQGALLWARDFGGSGVDIGYALALDGAGNALLTGCFTDRIAFGGSELVARDRLDIFVAKLGAADGRHLWSRGFGSTGHDVGHAIACDAAGNVVLSGFFQGPLEVGDGQPALASAGKADIFVLRLDAQGQVLWARGIGGSASDYGRALALTPAGDVVVAGGFQGQLGFGGGATLASGGGYDLFLACLAGADGTHRWSTSFPAASAQQARALAVDADGRVLMAGEFSGRLDFGGGALVAAQEADAFVAVFDAGGRPLESMRLGAAAADLGRAITALPGGGLALAGSFVGPATLAGFELPDSGARDAFVLALGSTNRGPITVQQALDTLAGGLESSDIGFALPACAAPGSGAPTLGRLLAERSGWQASQPLALDALLDALLCRVDAATVPATQGGRATTVQDTVTALWEQKVAKAGDRMTGALVVAGGGLAVGDVAAPGADNLVVKGRCTVQGDLVVQGATTSISTTQMVVEDNIVELNRYDGNAANTLDAGLQVYRGGAAPARLLWDEAQDRWLIGVGDKPMLAPVATGDAQDVVTGVVVFHNPSLGVLVESPMIAPFGAQPQGALVSVQLGLVEDDVQGRVSQLDAALRPLVYGARIDGASGRFSIVMRRASAGSGDVLLRWWAQLPRRQEHARVDADIVVQITPTQAPVRAGDTIGFSAAAHGVASLPGQDTDDVVWKSALPIANQQPHACTVTASMLGAFLVRAECRVDPTRFAEAVVTVAPATVTVAPPPAGLKVGDRHSFTATVTGTPHDALTWSVTNGAIDVNTGVFTATSGGTVVVTAMLKVATSVRGQVSFVIPAPPPVTVRLSPSSLLLRPNQTRALTVTVTNAQNPAVHWGCTKANRISALSNSGCTVRAGNGPESFSVTATSVEDGSASDISVVVVETGQ